MFTITQTKQYYTLLSILFFLLIVRTPLLAQGFINNGANLVLTNASYVVISGSNGHYTNDNNGLIHNASAGGEIWLEGNWINNASNQAFDNDGARVRLTGGGQSIGGSNSSVFYHLNLEGTGVKTLQVNTTAGGISNLTGVLSVGDRILDLNSNTLTVSNAATGAITSVNGYIISETNVAVNPSIVRWNMQAATGAHVFPFGVAGTSIPFTFNKTTNTPADISVSTRTTGSNNQPWAGISNVGPVTNMASATLGLSDASTDAVIDRWWDIQTTAPVTADITFSYRLSENTTTYSPLDFGAQHWNGSLWEAPLGSGSVLAGVGVVQANGLSSFSPYVLAPLVFPLPLTLLNFSAACLNGQSELRWISASEQNLSHYIIEKSRDGYDWTIVGEMNAVGNSNQENLYSFIDTEQSDFSYYRLKNRNFDGTVNTLATLSNDCRENGNSIKVYPNPSSGSFAIDINSEKKIGEASLLLSDMNGKTIHKRDIYLDKGVSSVYYENDIAPGVYFIYILGTKKEFEVLKLVIR